MRSGRVVPDPWQLRLSRNLHRAGVSREDGRLWRRCSAGALGLVMPELPEVEAVCRKLRPHVKGSTIVAMRVLRSGIVAPQSPAFVEESLTGQAIREVRRRGKN